MTLLLKSTAAFAGPKDAAEAGVVTRTAAEIYAAYAARVAADGGTMQNAAACLAAITDAVNNGYLYQAAVAISPSWGIKTSGANITKFYNLNALGPDGTTPDGTLANTTVLDTTSESFALAAMDGAFDEIFLTGVPLNISGNLLFALTGRWPSTGGQVTFTTGGQVWTMVDYTGRLDVNLVTVMLAGSEFAVPSKAAVGMLVEQDIQKITLVRDGVPLKSNTKSFTPITAGATADMVLKIAAGSDWRVAEFWYLNNATLAAAVALGTRMGTSY